jgi:hypothetical protein
MAIAELLIRGFVGLTFAWFGWLLLTSRALTADPDGYISLDDVEGK